MKTIVITGIVACLGLGMMNPALAKDAGSGNQEMCLRKANTVADARLCGKMDYKLLDKELNRVYLMVRVQHKDKSNFLHQLTNAQRAWVQFRDASLQMKYPAKNKRTAYGTAYKNCSSTFLATMTLDRIMFLKQWLIGVAEGDVCAGSVPIKK